MEHLIIVDMPDMMGYVRITAEQGYAVWSKVLRQVVAEAIVERSKKSQFKAIIKTWED